MLTSSTKIWIRIGEQARDRDSLSATGTEGATHPAMILTRRFCTRMRTRTTPLFYASACYGVVQCLPVVMHREPKTIASRPCTPPSILEMFGEKISASPGSSTGKEIAGLLRKMMMMMKMTRNREIAYERILAWKTGGR